MIKLIKSKIGSDIDTLNGVRTGSFNNLDKFAVISIVVLSALLYIPFLGNFFMIDPWENHYSHVAWETLERGSFAKLWYQNSNRFWSKPPLLFWMLMPFYKLHISEFMGRLPIALFSIGTLAGFYILLTRLVSRRASMLATLILMLSPHYFMLSRQIMVDLPFIGLNTIALLCMAIYFVGDIPEEEKIWKIPRKDMYLYLFYFFEGWGFLAKGLLSVVIPGTALFVFMLFTRNFGYAFQWRHLKKHLIGFGVYIAVIAPWMGYMWISEGFEFIKIFIWFHHFKRVAGEIHKPNDLYTLYLRI
ncbi:MAG TPA: glycosyltransferase family 39 protein, partial [bacterium]|nr:glycosyltransferase family 39 protein [bacterium]